HAGERAYNIVVPPGNHGAFAPVRKRATGLDEIQHPATLFVTPHVAKTSLTGNDAYSCDAESVKKHRDSMSRLVVSRSPQPTIFCCQFLVTHCAVTIFSAPTAPLTRSTTLSRTSSLLLNGAIFLSAFAGRMFQYRSASFGLTSAR